MLFELTNTSLGKRTHCGVLEFSAEEGRCYIPFWMMQNLVLSEGSLIKVKNVSLPKAQYVKFQAQSADFLEISNPKAVLEVSLRRFTCVTVGDHVMISYLGKNYYLEVREARPADAVSIIETDCNVDFDEPVGYKESEYAKSEKKLSSKEEKIQPIVRPLQKAKVETVDTAADEKGFKPFIGIPRRIDDKPLDSKATEKKGSEKVKDIPSYSDIVNSSNPPKAPQFTSRIGDKFSKKKTVVSSFSGPANKLK